MLCDKCGKNKATVHYQQVINGVTSEQHLCSQCAAGFGQLDFNKLFSAPVKSAPAAVCPICGMNINEFRSKGRLGCSKCYETFGEYLRPLIKRYHGEARHKGKIPKPLKYSTVGGELLSPPEGAAADRIYEKMALQKQLAELVELERFEEAAEIRDKIREVEAEIESQRAGEGK